jgi:hypothetical protein
MESKDKESKLKRTCVFAYPLDLPNGMAVICNEKHGNKKYQDYKELRDVPPEDICVGSGRACAGHSMLEWFYVRWNDMEDCPYCKKTSEGAYLPNAQPLEK